MKAFLMKHFVYLFFLHSIFAYGRTAQTSKTSNNWEPLFDITTKIQRNTRCQEQWHHYQKLNTKYKSFVIRFNPYTKQLLSCFTWKQATQTKSTTQTALSQCEQKRKDPELCLLYAKHNRIIVQDFIYNEIFPKKRRLLEEQIQKFGHTGFILYTHEATHRVYAKQLRSKRLPPIISDYHSYYSVLGFYRNKRHRGLDIFVGQNQKIIASADGKVISYNEDADCVGGSLIVELNAHFHHPPIYMAYVHITNPQVKKGEHITRGQSLATVNTKVIDRHCMGGMKHLHIELWQSNKMQTATPFSPDHHKLYLNPRYYWTLSPGEPECFAPNKHYPPNKLTYPVAC